MQILVFYLANFDFQRSKFGERGDQEKDKKLQ